MNHPEYDFCGDCSDCGYVSDDPRPHYPPCSECGDDNYPFHPKVDFVDLNGETFWYCGPCSELREEELKAAKERWAKIKAAVKND